MPESRHGIKANSDRIAKEVIGMSESDAFQKIREEGVGFRIAQREDEVFDLPFELGFDRVTVVVKDGLVTEAKAG